MGKAEVEAAAAVAARVSKGLRTFLETAGLYAPTDVDFGSGQLHVRSGVVPDVILVACGRCGGDRTWSLTEADSPEILSADSSHRVFVYGCSDCKVEAREFWLRFVVQTRMVQAAPTTLSNNMSSGAVVPRVIGLRVEKIGQWPSPRHKIPNRIDQALGDDAALYQKALSCISNGFGIGAHAYMRCVVEKRTDLLLDQIEKVLTEDADDALLGELNAARAADAASERIKLAAKALPPVLRPGGTNPLGLLYGALSATLHGETEESEALEQARVICQMFEFLMMKSAEHIEDAVKFKKTVTAMAAGRSPK